MRNSSRILLPVFLLTAATLLAQTPIPVTIHVTDPSGSAIAHATGRITSSNLIDVKFETDSRGEAIVNLPPGSYSLSIAAPGFKSEARQIAVAAGEPRAGQVISVILRAAAPTSSGPVDSSGTLLLTGDHTSLALTPEECRALPHITLSVHNSHTNADETYSGVPLPALLAKVNAPMGKDLHGDAMTSYLLATGSDGYSVVLALADVDPDFRDSQVIVADTRDGQPLARNGPFQLIVQGDKRPARWVRNLVSIRLSRAQ